MLPLQNLTTGTASLDWMLGGAGFIPKLIYEINGFPGVGKSLLLHQLACTARLPHCGLGADAGVLYIDSENSFSRDLIERMSERFGMRANHVLSRLTLLGRSSAEGLSQLFKSKLEGLVQRKRVRLICLDRAADHLNPPAQSPAERKTLGLAVHALRRVAKDKNLVVVITNRVEYPSAQSLGDGAPRRYDAGYTPDLSIRPEITNWFRSHGLILFYIMKPYSDMQCMIKRTPEGFWDAPIPKLASFRWYLKRHPDLQLLLDNIDVSKEF